MSVTPEDLAKITLIQQRVLNGETVAIEELREAIRVARALRAGRLAQATKPKKTAPPSLTMEDLSNMLKGIRKEGQ